MTTAIETEKPFHTVTIQKGITRDQILNLVCSCFEGGYSSWCQSIEGYVLPDGVKNADFKEGGSRLYQDWRGVYSVITDPDCKVKLLVEEPSRDDRENYLVEIGPEEIRKGLDLFSKSEQYNHHWHNFISENDDAITGDVFMQFVVYGEVIYG